MPNTKYILKIISGLSSVKGIKKNSENKNILDNLIKGNLLSSISTLIDKDKIFRADMFFDFLNIPNGKIREIKNKKILILDCGAGGSSLIYLLSQFGFLELFVIDDDIISESDIYRVMVFNKTDIGEKRVWEFGIG